MFIVPVTNKELANVDPEVIDIDVEIVEACRIASSIQIKMYLLYLTIWVEQEEYVACQLIRTQRSVCGRASYHRVVIESDVNGVLVPTDPALLVVHLQNELQPVCQSLQDTPLRVGLPVLFVVERAVDVIVEIWVICHILGETNVYHTIDRGLLDVCS